MRGGVRSGRDSLVVHLAGNPLDHGPVVVGFVVSKAIGNAVVRNRVKRRLRAVVSHRIDQLPEGFQVAAQFNPLFQLVELVRGAAFGFETVDILRVAGLIVFSLIMWRIAVRQLGRRLID